MKAVYLDLTTPSKDAYFDLFTYQYLYLLAEKSKFGCPISHFIYTRNNRNKWTDDFITNRTRQLYPEEDLPKWEKDAAKMLSTINK